MALIDDIRHIRDDVSQLEINTILKANMTGQKMPRPRHALIDIARRYGTTLRELHPSAEIDAVMKETTCDLGTFSSLRTIAAGLGADRERELRERRGEMSEDELVEAQRQIAVLGRIRRNCDHIKALLRALFHREPELEKETGWTRAKIEELGPDERELPLTSNERVMLRKIWELGVDEVVMQTVIQLDGDVVTRIDPRYANEGAVAIRAFHKESTEVSLRMWKDLVETVASFFRNIVKGLTG